MKTSKLLITSLFAAAATLSVPAYADLLGNVTYTGGNDISQGTTLGAYTTSESITTGTTTTSTNFVSSVPVGGNFWPGAYTMMFWIDFGSNTISSDSVIFEYGGSANTGALGSNALVISSAGELIFGRGQYENNTSYTFQDANKVTTSSLGLTSGVHHIAVTSAGTSGDGNILKIYVDGVEQTLYAADGTTPDSNVNLNMNGYKSSFVSSTEVLATNIGLNYGDAMLYGDVLSQQTIQKLATHNIYDLTWNGGETGNWNTTDANWTRAGAEGSVAFENYDNVTFAGNATVTVSEDVTASSVSVTGGNVSFSGSGSIFSTNGVTVSGSGVLSIDKYGDGSKSIIHGKLLIENGGKVKLTDGDATGYNGGSNAINTLVINEGGELIIETNSYAGTNQTFNMSGGITLQGGKISGTNADGYSKFDLFNSNTGITTLASSTTAEIQASIGLRLNGTFDVAAGTTADGVDLLVSGRLTSKAKFGNTSNNESFSTTLRKIGAGTMKLTGDNQYWTTGGTVEAGKLVAASANALGTGSITVNGDGSILDFSVAGGTFEQGSNQALTTTNGGKITVSAGTLALTGAVNLSNAIEVADGATVTTTRGVVFALSGLTGTANEDGTTTFTLFTLESGAALTWDSLTAENLNIVGSSLAARDATATFNADGTMTFTEGEAGDLVWNGTSGNSTWNYTATNTNWKIGDGAAYFQYKDNVTFGADATVKTVTLVDGTTYGVGNATIEGSSAYTFSLASGTATISGTTLTVENGSTLNVGASDLRTIALDFDDISLSGKLVYNNGATTWKKLTFAAADAELKLEDLATGNNVTGLTVTELKMSANGKITSNYGGKVAIGSITGAGDLSIAGPTSNEAITFTLGALSGSGKISTVAGTGTGTLNVEIGGNNSSFTGTLEINAGTVKLTSSQNTLGATDREAYAAVVKSGGTLDINGKTQGGNNCYKIELAGGALVNNGDNVGTEQRQITGLKLSANSTVGGSGNFGLIADGYAKNNLELGGFTLTKTGSNNFWLTSTTVDNGVVDVQGGFLYLSNGGDSGEEFKMMSSAMLKANGGEIKAGSAGVALGNVAIVLTDTNKNTARLTKNSNTCSFTISEGAKLYLDIGLLTDAVLTGDEVALTIAGANVISAENFFDTVLVGTYVSGDNWINDTEWAYKADSWDASTGTLSLISVPEPSAFGLLAGAGALALVAARRRRQKKA